MTSPDDAGRRADAPPGTADFSRILRAVDLLEGFVLFPVNVPGPDLARALAAWLGANGHPAEVIEPHDDAGWRGSCPGSSRRSRLLRA